MRERVLERFAFDEGHRVVQHAFAIARRQQWDDVRVLQLRGELDLATEPFAVDAGSKIGRENLDDDFAIERPFRRDKHAAHPAATQLALDLVGGPNGRPERIEQWVRRRCHEQRTLRARFWCRKATVDLTPRTIPRAKLAPDQVEPRVWQVSSTPAPSPAGKTPQSLRTSPGPSGSPPPASSTS